MQKDIIAEHLADIIAEQEHTLGRVCHYMTNCHIIAIDALGRFC